MSLRLKRTKELIVLAVSLAVAFVTTARADILHVPGDFPTIQEAIDAAVDGDEVEVHLGTYFETINFLSKAIRVYSTDGPDVTIINANGIGAVVTCNDLGPETVLEGFTITGGNEGGMLNNSSSPTVIGCVFVDNHNNGTGGGGMANFNTSSPTVMDCQFIGNSSQNGGGMWNESGSPVIIGCLFEGNETDLNGSGGGIFNHFQSQATITDCTFAGNTAQRGGAMFIGGRSPTINNCSFIGNSADFGGAIYNEGDPIFVNCLIRGNEALIGGGMFNPASLNFPVLVNCTVVQNVAAVGGGVVNDAFTLLTISNSIVRLNQPDQIVDDPLAATTVFYSNVQDGWPGVGNIDADPLFVDPDGGDYRLSSGSPSIDAGHNWRVPIDENDYDEDGILCELFPVDLDGNPRFNADEADFDPGCGVPVVVDMGAYEYQFDPADQVTFADLNGDGAVGVKDLLGLLGSWGPCAKGCCLADLDLDGNVGVKDLLILLGNWGPCP